MFKDIRLTAMLDEFGEIKTELIKKNENEFEIAENEYVQGSIIIKNYDKSYVINACSIDVMYGDMNIIKPFETSVFKLNINK